MTQVIPEEAASAKADVPINLSPFKINVESLTPSTKYTLLVLGFWGSCFDIGRPLSSKYFRSLKPSSHASSSKTKPAIPHKPKLATSLNKIKLTTLKSALV